MYLLLEVLVLSISSDFVGVFVIRWSTISIGNQTKQQHLENQYSVISVNIIDRLIKNPSMCYHEFYLKKHRVIVINYHYDALTNM